MARPQLISLTPTTVNLNSTTNVDITGTEFDGTSVASVGAVYPSIDAATRTKTFLRLQITPEVTATVGTKKVRVRNTPDGLALEELKFEVIDPAAAVAGGAVVAHTPAAPAPKIGIISSIGFRGTPMERSFKLGLAHPNWLIDCRDDKGYDPGVLAGEARTLCRIASIELVISFGGNIVAETLAPIATVEKMNFMSVLGNLVPEVSESKYACGGVNLDTVARNAERFNRLTRELNIPASEICFLSNDASAMAIAEQSQWEQLNPTGQFFSFNPLSCKDPSTGAVTPDAVRKGFQDQVLREFARNGALSTMLVSADPLFQKYKNELIGAANGVDKRVCYPLQTFRNNGGSSQPTQRHFVHGPKLARACFFLGRDAAEVLINSDKRLGFRTPPMLIDSNDDES